MPNTNRRLHRSIILVARCALVSIALGACGEPTQAPTAQASQQDVISLQRGTSYRIGDIGNLGGTAALAWRVNERGQVIGWATTASGNTHAFVWTASRGISDLGTFVGGTGSVAWGLNDDGAVVGEIDLPLGHTRAFLWTASGGMRDLGTLGGDDALAQGINNRGEVVGFSTLAAGGPTHGFVWTARGGMKDAGLFDNANTRLRTIDGAGTTGAGTGAGQAVLWHPSTGFTGLGFLAGGGFSYCARINDREQAAGFSETDISIHAFRWTTGTGMTDLGSLSGIAGRSEALDISNGGDIVGGSTTAADTANLHAFLWTPNHGMRQLPALSGDVDDEAYGMNESGTIVGYADSPDGRRHAIVWTPRQN
jgi:probable HAF family extracellular repeat protein